MQHYRKPKNSNPAAFCVVESEQHKHENYFHLVREGDFPYLPLPFAAINNSPSSILGHDRSIYEVLLF